MTFTKKKNGQTKNLESLQYLLGIDVVRSKKKISFSQQKYCVGYVAGSCMLRYKAADTLMYLHGSKFEINT